MKSFSALLILLSLITGCATQVQHPVPFSVNSEVPSVKIGIVTSAIPDTTMTYPGASCLLCLAAAAAGNSDLSGYAKTLSSDDLIKIKKLLEQKLTSLGYDVVVIDNDLKVKNLPKLKTKVPNSAKNDYSWFKETYGVDYLLAVDLRFLGLQRNYSAYVPTGDPKVVVQGLEYMVNIQDNTYGWYKPLYIVRTAEGEWKEPPDYPGLTNAYYQAVEALLDEIVKTELPAKSIETSAKAPESTNAQPN